MEPFELCLTLSRVDALVRRRLEVQGLSLNDLAVLRHLLDAPSRQARRVDLAELLGMTPSGVARLLAPLEKLGYVAREADPHDARVALVTLTDAGAERTQEALEVARDKASSLFDRVLDTSERARLGELLVRLVPVG